MGVPTVSMRTSSGSPRRTKNSVPSVIPREGAELTFDDLTAHLLGLGMAKFKLPERLELMDDFPLSPFGKVSKKALVERFA